MSPIAESADVNNLDLPGRGPMSWFVASLRDHDTHQVTEFTQGTVAALCDHEFRPLIRLRGTPLDPRQICPTCAQSPPTTTQDHNPQPPMEATTSRDGIEGTGL